MDRRHSRAKISMVRASLLPFISHISLELVLVAGIPLDAGHLVIR